MTASIAEGEQNLEVAIDMVQGFGEDEGEGKERMGRGEEGRGRVGEERGGWGRWPSGPAPCTGFENK